MFFRAAYKPPGLPSRCGNRRNGIGGFRFWRSCVNDVSSLHSQTQLPKRTFVDSSSFLIETYGCPLHDGRLRYDFTASAGREPSLLTRIGSNVLFVGSLK